MEGMRVLLLSQQRKIYRSLTDLLEMRVLTFYSDNEAVPSRGEEEIGTHKQSAPPGISRLKPD